MRYGEDKLPKTYTCLRRLEFTDTHCTCAERPLLPVLLRIQEQCLLPVEKMLVFPVGSDEIESVFSPPEGGYVDKDGSSSRGKRYSLENRKPVNIDRHLINNSSVNDVMYLIAIKP